MAHELREDMLAYVESGLKRNMAENPMDLDGGGGGNLALNVRRFLKGDLHADRD